MLLKPADNKDRDIAELEAAVARSSGERRAGFERDLRNLRTGIKAEQEAAYLIDFDLRASRFTAVIHDLRLEIKGRVAQIDHLLIHRTLNVFVLETKHFHAGMKITEDGEFLRWNDYRKTYEGMPSPFAQNDRHISVLKDAFDSIDMPTRMGFRLSPTFISLVVVSPNARIDRPSRFDTSRVIKADMVLKAVETKLDKEGVLETLVGASRLVSGETVVDIGRRLLALHRPAPLRAALSSQPDATQAPPSAMPPTQRTRGAHGVLDIAPRGAGPVCRTCGQADLAILHGRYGYYFKCRACSANTPIKLDCGYQGHKERLRKEALNFYRECADCGTSRLFYSNPK